MCTDFPQSKPNENWIQSRSASLSEPATCVPGLLSGLHLRLTAATLPHPLRRGSNRHETVARAPNCVATLNGVSASEKDIDQRTIKLALQIIPLPRRLSDRRAILTPI